MEKILEHNEFEDDILIPFEKHELTNLLDSAKPFYRPPSNMFGGQIFPSSWNDLNMAHCFYEVLEMQAWQQPPIETAIDRCLNILKSHIEFYKTKIDENLEGTHDVTYTSEELVCMAEHLQKKISNLKAADPAKKGDLDLTKVIEEILFPSPR